MTGYLPALAGVAVVHLVATAIPGPNVLLVMRAAMTRSRADGLAVTAGIAISDVVWAVTAIVGLTALFASVAWLTTSVQVLGGGYLVYVGIRTWQAARTHAVPVGNPTGGSFVTGLVTNLTNPKSAVFFGSVFATTLPLGAPPWVWFTVVGIIAVNAVWFHYLLAVLFSLASARRVYERAKAWCDRVLGGLLSSLGAYFIIVAWRESA
nr:LysE family transporter [Kibdelosporangium sp. MJ126-NF4]CEL15837.1 Threonine efflux protein [Kibdelosporangium sp. MJ126-NF4]CTQ93762.1 Threonine efflux protein [Kibdelosporangium sp. MJ126-NF4]